MDYLHLFLLMLELLFHLIFLLCLLILFLCLIIDLLLLYISLFIWRVLVLEGLLRMGIRIFCLCVVNVRRFLIRMLVRRMIGCTCSIFNLLKKHSISIMLLLMLQAKTTNTLLSLIWKTHTLCLTKDQGW